MRVMLIKGVSAYDALRVFIDSLSDAFIAKGHDVILIDLADGSDSLKRIEQAAQTQAIDLIFTYNILGEFRDQYGRSLSEIVGAPHVIQYVDYPLTHASRLEGTSAQTALLVIDRSHLDLIKSVYGQDRFAHVSFSPHAAVGDRVDLETYPELWAKNRDIPILFAGTFYKPKTETWPSLSARLKHIFDNAIDMALSAEWMPALDALDQAFLDKGYNPQDPEISPIRRLSTLIHEYVRAHRRFELLKTAAKLDLPIHIYGSGYDQVRYRFKNATFGGDASLPEVVELMKRSRIVLNINANFGAGSHERPFNALLAGAVAATDYSRFFDDAFAEDEEIVFYRWQNLHSDLQAIGSLAETPDRALRIAQAGQKRVAQEHLWANRITTIIDAAQAVKPRSRATLSAPASSNPP